MKPGEGPYGGVRIEDNEGCWYKVEGPFGEFYAGGSEGGAVELANVFNRVHNVAYRLGQEKMRKAAISGLDSMVLGHPGRADKTVEQCMDLIRALPIDGEGKGE